MDRQLTIHTCAVGPGQISSANLDVDGRPMTMRLCGGKESSLADSRHRLCIVSKPVGPLASSHGSPRSSNVVELWQKHWVIVHFSKVRCAVADVPQSENRPLSMLPCVSVQRDSDHGRPVLMLTLLRKGIAGMKHRGDADLLPAQDKGRAADVTQSLSYFGAVRGVLMIASQYTAMPTDCVLRHLRTFDGLKIITSGTTRRHRTSTSCAGADERRCMACDARGTCGEYTIDFTLCKRCSDSSGAQVGATPLQSGRPLASRALQL